MDLQNPLKTPKAFTDNITRSPCMHYWVNNTVLHCKSHWPLTDIMIDFPEASNCGLTTGTLRSWVLLDALIFQINGMFSVLNWLPGARMMYSMCQCVGVDVCVISLLLIPAVNTSSCPSLTSSMSSRTVCASKHKWPSDHIKTHRSLCVLRHIKLFMFVMSLLCVNILKFSLPGEFHNNGNLDTRRDGALVMLMLLSWWLRELLKEYFILIHVVDSCFFRPRETYKQKQHVLDERLWDKILHVVSSSAAREFFSFSISSIGW